MDAEVSPSEKTTQRLVEERVAAFAMAIDRRIQKLEKKLIEVDTHLADVVARIDEIAPIAGAIQHSHAALGAKLTHLAARLKERSGLPSGASVSSPADPSAPPAAAAPPARDDHEGEAVMVAELAPAPVAVEDARVDALKERLETGMAEIESRLAALGAIEAKLADFEARIEGARAERAAAASDAEGEESAAEPASEARVADAQELALALAKTPEWKSLVDGQFRMMLKHLEGDVIPRAVKKLLPPAEPPKENS